MLQLHSRVLPKNHYQWEATSRCLFAFGKKKEAKTESTSPEKLLDQKRGGLSEEQVSDKDIHKLNKEQKAVSELPIKVIPSNQERRLTWLSRKAIIFYVPKERSGYAPDYEMEYSWRAVKQGWKFFLEEAEKWWKERTSLDIISVLPVETGVVDKVFHFKGPDSLFGWVTTCDSDHNEGFSTVDFSCNKDGRAVFSGELSTRLPKDGRIKYAGYSNIRCPTKYLSWKSIDPYNWIIYNTMELRIRGDGRSYMVNLHVPGPFDTLRDDIFNYPLYTRGGPYWQVVRIPFSKFIFSNKGKIQDTQYAVPPDHIQFISITLADNADGPYKLEIDYIGVVFDNAQEHEERAYEEYKVRDLMVQN